ncbi:MAG: methyltransferase domain-containing protein [Chthoniobacterales bacterium]
MIDAAPRILEFQCNICGANCQFPFDQLGRETDSCKMCHSTPRVRAIVDILARHLIGRSIPLPQFPGPLPLRGLGLTDSENYAARLREKFDYQNTYLHQEPRFDISAPLAPNRSRAYDFVIASEIFEHVSPPVSRAFENACQLLKPGGLFILTVPYGTQPETVEHFPELHDYTIAEVEGRHVLSNRTRQGAMQRYDDLIFHGGPGSTLEMRIFSESDLNRHLTDAGFSEIIFYREPVLPYGIAWPEPWSRPIAALKSRHSIR